MMRKKLGVILLTMAMLVGNGVLVSAAEKGNAGNVESDLLQETVAELEKGYSEYYDIQDTEMTLCCSHEEDGEVENTYLLEMTVVLKADSVEEMPYYQGAANYCETMTASLGRLRTEDNRLRVDMLSSKQTELYDELEEYIGKEQKLTFYMKESYPSDNETQKEILFESGLDYVKVGEILPTATQQLRQCGYAAVAYEDAQYLKKKESAETLQSKASFAYEVAEAVSYMRKYTSNPTVCEVCGKPVGKKEGQCSSGAAPSKYNKNYLHYADIHSDCANYVSQALCEGGIPTDNKWKPDSVAWKNVDSLIAYMCNNGYGTSVSYSVVQRGDLIKFSSGSHVVMITSFDGVTYKYSGHTCDRLDMTQTITSTLGKYYRIG